MGTKKISALTTGTTANSTDKIPIARSGANYYITPAMIQTFIGGGGGSLAVEEVDGTPTDSAVTKIKFPNSTLSITSHVATYTPTTTQGGQSKLATAQSISDNSATNISFDTENYDTDSMIDIGGNPTRITINTDGTYIVIFTGYFASNATGYRWAAIYEGGSLLTSVDSKAAVNGTVTGLNPHAVLQLVGGNYLEIKCYQNSGGSLNVAGVFTAHRIA